MPSVGNSVNRGTLPFRQRLTARTLGVGRIRLGARVSPHPPSRAPGPFSTIPHTAKLEALNRGVYASVCKLGFREARLSETGFPRRTLLGDSLNKRVANIRFGSVQVCGCIFETR